MGHINGSVKYVCTVKDSTIAVKISKEQTSCIIPCIFVISIPVFAISKVICSHKKEKPISIRKKINLTFKTPFEIARGSAKSKTGHWWVNKMVTQAGGSRVGSDPRRPLEDIFLGIAPYRAISL